VGQNGVGFLSGVTSLATGTSHVLALRNDGSVWGWGGNPSGS
jgi:alpha-tubulin suppressor-like RCC1 family protein